MQPNLPPKRSPLFLGIVSCFPGIVLGIVANICSMYGIFTYIWLQFMLNVGKYSSPIGHLGSFFSSKWGRGLAHQPIMKHGFPERWEARSLHASVQEAVIHKCHGWITGRLEGSERAKQLLSRVLKQILVECMTGLCWWWAAKFVRDTNVYLEGPPPTDFKSGIAGESCRMFFCSNKLMTSPASVNKTESPKPRRNLPMFFL